MTCVWSSRSGLYLCGVVLLVLATLLFAAAHIAPFWVQQDSNTSLGVRSVNIGLWFQCYGDRGEECVWQNLASDKPYLKAVRVLQLLGLLGLTGSMAAAFFLNCRRHYRGHTIFLEVVTCLAGLQSLSGSMVYLGYTCEDVSKFQYLHYHWAFAASVAASGLALVASVIILIGNRRTPVPEERVSSPATAKTLGSWLDWQSTPGYREEGFHEHRPWKRQSPLGNDPYYGRDHDVDYPYHANDVHPLPSLPPWEYNDLNDPVSDVHSRQHNFYNIEHVGSGGLSEEAFRGGGRHRGHSESSEEGRSFDMTGYYHDDNRLAVANADFPSARRPQLDGGRQQSGFGVKPLSHTLDAREVYQEPSSRVMELSPFTLPRVVVRGFYEPGQGYPEYIIGGRPKS